MKARLVKPLAVLAALLVVALILVGFFALVRWDARSGEKSAREERRSFDRANRVCGAAPAQDQAARHVVVVRPVARGHLQGRNDESGAAMRWPPCWNCGQAVLVVQAGRLTCPACGYTVAEARTEES